MPVEPSDFAAKSALYLPREAQFDYLVNLPDNILDAHLKGKDGHDINSLGEAVNNAMQLVEDQSEQLTGVLPKTYTMFADDLLRELLRIFNNKTIDEVGGDIIGRIYEYFLQICKGGRQRRRRLLHAQVTGKNARQCARAQAGRYA